MAESNGDDAVLAEYAHRGEKVVAVLRLLAWIAFGISSAAVGAATHERSETDPVRGAVIAAWFLFGVAVLITLRRVSFTAARARTWPLAMMLVDYAVLTYLQLNTARDHRPEVGTSVIAIVLAFSVARFNGFQIWVSCALACASVFTQALWIGWFNARSVAMIVSSYLALSAMIWWGNRTIRRMFIEVRKRERLSRLLPDQVVKRVMAEGPASLAPAQREVTILFSDLRDFTSLSQRMPPGEVLALLDGYFERMTAVVKAHGGMVNKFLGDGMLAVWGAPEPLADHPVRAVSAALEMRTALAALNTERSARGEVALRIGIGIHSGLVAAGMLGGAQQTEYTVLGDAVNLASRIEGLCKKLQADLVVSEATLRGCGDTFLTEHAGAEEVKGRDEAVTVYRVIGVRGP